MNIFTLKDNDDTGEKINMDDLYEKKREYDEGKLKLYNKILGRIHNKIKMTSRQNINDHFCWYLIPEVMIGISKYNVNECLGYIIDKLMENGFVVRYTHPNLIFISWNHYVPNYVRQELKKKTGIVVDKFGNKVSENGNGISIGNINGNGNAAEEQNVDNFLINMKTKNGGINNNNKKNENKDYKSITNYKPSGIYNNDLFKSIENKTNS